MSNKYNLGAINLAFNPIQVKQNNIIVIQIDDSYKKEPVLQMEDNVELKLLYYFDKIFIYMMGTVKYFVIELTCDKGPEIYIMFDIEVNTNTATDDNTSVGKILQKFVNAENKTVNADGIIFNNEIRNKKVQRTGNVLYIGTITVSYMFPITQSAIVAFLPQTLKDITSTPTAGQEVQLRPEEIQWVLECNQLSEDGKIKVDLSEDKTSIAYFVSGVFITFAVLLAYLFMVYYPQAMSALLYVWNSILAIPGLGTAISFIVSSISALYKIISNVIYCGSLNIYYYIYTNLFDSTFQKPTNPACPP